MVPLVFALMIAAFLPSIECQSVPRRGTVRLVRDASVIQAQSVSSGRVQIWTSPNRAVFDTWGHICYDNDFSITGAIVICHQLGFSSASSFSRTSQDSFGFDVSVPYALDEVDCSTSTYLVILQCRHNTFISSRCRVNGDEVSVTCLSTRIWSSPYDGQIRLQGAQYTNQGLVEVYCNGQWGTICENGFGSTDADTVCRQQGYNRAADRDSLSLTGNSDQPIWFTLVPCAFTESCLRRCQRCPSTRVTSCTHSEDITVECEVTLGGSSTRISTCDFGTTTTTITSAITGIVVGVVILVLICTCFCCCLGIGICAANRNRGPSTRFVTTSAPPPATAVVTPAQTTAPYPTQQPTTYPTQPPPAYAALPPSPYPAQPLAAYPPAAYPPHDAYPPPDGGYPPQPYFSTKPPA